MAGTLLATEALAQIGVTEISEGVSRVFLVERKVRELSVMVMLLLRLLRPLSSPLPLEHFIEVPQRIKAAQLEAQVLGTPREVVANIGVCWHQVLLVVKAL